MDPLFARSSYETVAEQRITQAIYTKDAARTLSDVATGKGVNAKIFVKIDTGLRRVGVNHKEVARATL